MSDIQPSVAIQSDTPRSDGQRMSHERYAGYVANSSGPVVPLEFARELERELAESIRFLEGEKIARQYAIDKGVELQRENTLLREAIKWAEPYVPKHSETYRMISELPNVQAQR